MLFGREQFTITTEMDGEVIDKLYAKELIPTPIEEFEKLPEDQKKLQTVFDNIPDAVGLIIKGKTQDAMNRYNKGPEKPKPAPKAEEKTAASEEK